MGNGPTATVIAAPAFAGRTPFDRRRLISRAASFREAGTIAICTTGFDSRDRVRKPAFCTIRQRFGVATNCREFVDSIEAPENPTYQMAYADRFSSIFLVCDDAVVRRLASVARATPFTLSSWEKPNDVLNTTPARASAARVGFLIRHEIRTHPSRRRRRHALPCRFFIRREFGEKDERSTAIGTGEA